MWICTVVREGERRPEGDAADDRAAEQFDEAGHDVPPDSHLDAERSR